jgi:hypothetical protein
MDIRRTLTTVGILGLAFLLLLGGYLLFGRGEKENGQQKPSVAKAYGIDREKVARIHIAYAAPDLPDITLEKTDGTWRLKAPLDAVADEDEVRALLQTLEQNVRKRVQGDLAAFGLDAPQVRMTVSTADNLARTFLFGNKGVSYSLYAKEQNDADAFVVESYILDTLTKTPAELRDRTVLRFDRADVRRVEVVPTRGVGRSPAIIAERKDADADWQLAAPTPAKADGKKIDDALLALSELRAEAFVADGVTDFAAYGLAQPARVVRLALAQGGAYVGLRIAAAATADEPLRVAPLGSRSVFSLTPDALSFLPDTAWDWRDKRVADFQRTETTKIEVAMPTGGYTLEKKVVDGKDSWRISKPRSLKADDATVGDLLFRLDGLEALRILNETGADSARYGLERPQLTLTFHEEREAGAAAVTIRFGRAVDGGIAVQSSRSPAIAVVEPSAVAEWREGIPALRDKVVLDFDSDDVRGVELARGTSVVACTRFGSTWRITRPSLEPADSATVNGILFALDGLKASRFLSSAPAGAGLGSPALRVTLLLDDGSRRVLRFGTKKGDFLYAQLEGDPDVFLADSSVLESVDKSLADLRASETKTKP